MLGAPSNLAPMTSLLCDVCEYNMAEMTISLPRLGLRMTWITALLLLLLLSRFSRVRPHRTRMRPHRRQPTRLPHPWDSPGKNTGVGCHFLL